MKNSGTCPKCGSQEVVHVPKMAYHYVPINMLQAVPLARYICIQCGYCEEWIDSAEDRAKLREHYSGN